MTTAAETRPAGAAEPAVARKPPGGFWRKVRWHALNVFAGLVLLYLFIPISVIILFSFNGPAGKFNLTWHRFTLDAWKHPFGAPGLQDAVVLSLKIAFLSTLGATALGTLAALALARYSFRGRSASNFAIFTPMATPEIVMGSALLSFFLLIGTFSLGFETLLIAHVMFCISFVVVVVRSRLIGFDRHLEEAAKDLGASSFETFRLVTLPLIMPGIFGAAMLAFALSIDDFVISNFNAGTTVTFPLYIFGASQRGIPVEVNVIAMILFFFTCATMGFATWQQRRSEKMTEVRPEQEAGVGAGPGVPAGAPAAT
jgi:spermidine/putrescine transport system permease protein